MASTLLQLITDVADEVGVAAPDFVVGNSDQNARRMLALANNAGRHVAKAHDWSDLTVQHTITTVADQTTYTLPAVFDRLISETTWGNQVRLRGSLTARQLAFRQQLTSPQFVNGYRLKLSTAGSSVIIDPAPANDGDEITTYFVSKNWCKPADSEIGQDRWQADTDIAILDENLIRLGTVWRVKNALGLPYAEEKFEYEDMLKSAVIDDLSFGWQHMTEHLQSTEPSMPRTPEGNWGI